MKQTDAYEAIKQALINKVPPNVVINTTYKVQTLSSVLNIEENSSLLIATNVNGYYGAVAVLEDQVWDAILEKYGNQDYYILPSSIHEVLLVPTSSSIDIEMLRSTVKMVNATEVSEADKLSDDVYLFDHVNRQIVFA